MAAAGGHRHRRVRIERVIDRDVPLGVIVRRTGPGRLIDEWNQLAAFAADVGWDEAGRLAARHPEHFTMLDASLPIGVQLEAVAGESTGIERIPMPRPTAGDSPGLSEQRPRWDAPADIQSSFE